MPMPDDMTNRDAIIEALRRELVGPDPRGSDLDTSVPPVFGTMTDANGPWRDKGTRQEILTRDRPCRRYGVGVLYPVGARPQVSDVTDTAASEGIGGAEAAVEARTRLLDEHAQQSLDAIQQRAERKSWDARDDGDALDLSLANAYQPGSMGVSLLAEIPPTASLVVRVKAARYETFAVTVKEGGRTWHWWRRVPVEKRVTWSARELVADARRKLPLGDVSESPEGLNGLSVEVLARSHETPPGEHPRVLLTVCVVNRQDMSAMSRDAACFFQCELEVSVTNSEGRELVLPYPGVPTEQRDQEEQEIDLLYRQTQTFAIGHGCAAVWAPTSGDRCGTVHGSALPVIETPSVTPDIVDAAGKPVEVGMNILAGLVEGRDGFDDLARIIDGYRAWITAREQEAALLPDHHQAAAERHLALCRRAAERMQDGVIYLKERPQALAAFRLANHAMLLQQLRNLERKPRQMRYEKPTKDAAQKAGVWRFDEEFPPLASPLTIPDRRGQWRPFQIAFLLLSLRSTADGEDDEREHVELIWFPTGGGKTEAYLGLAAFAMFLRRLRGVDVKHPTGDTGVEVLMRYTLRLLTAQQFQRAAALVCAMEHLRRQDVSRLGGEAFKIGIWVGGTPNTRRQAIDALRALRKGGDPDHNIVVLERCPWCRASLGKYPERITTVPAGRAHRGRNDGSFPVLGYVEGRSASGQDTVVARCSDEACPFHRGLPVEFVDEDIYDAGAASVSILIGTVDKFAMLAWRPTARRLFGIAPDGTRMASPPGLVIQDELHLISGPLGSMVGLYEGVIEYLCTDRRAGRGTKPKLVTSTATIRNYREQVHALFGRGNEKVALFPPPGLDAGDSYFASRARDRVTGKLQRGRIYVGVHAPGLGSSQTAQVRSFSALLQAPLSLSPVERDPWWTLLLFYNSIRELGGALTLFQTDIVEYLGALKVRHGIDDWNNVRHLYEVRELTGRLRDDEVTSAISRLETAATATGTKARSVDACLASNIIEVGVDIDRLSLMAVVGQPKTTAQYIQVTGRVGRRWWERPGLVVTIYGASKPRDRSHFERFQSYHERLYAQVEPTSVTPFSRPALDRALHGLMAIFARQLGDGALANRPTPLPHALMDTLRHVLETRVGAIDADEVGTLHRIFDARMKEWRDWDPSRWADDSTDSADIPLLRWPGSYASPERAAHSWQTPSSMRNVDAECEVKISLRYSPQDAAPPAERTNAPVVTP
jgi:hypothetical protein